MEFEKFKKQFDDSFGKVTPQEFVQSMEQLGYVFANKNKPNNNDEIVKKWAFHLRESAISEESAITEAINDAISIYKESKEYGKDKLVMFLKIQNITKELESLRAELDNVKLQFTASECELDEAKRELSSLREGKEAGNVFYCNNYLVGFQENRCPSQCVMCRDKNKTINL